jgi:ArsR family transcriptional regulator
MKILCECGLVNARKEGKWQHYSINKEVWEQLNDFINMIGKA